MVTPPTGTASPTATTVVLAVVGFAALCVVGWSMRDTLAKRSSLGLWLLLSAAIGGFAETNSDILTGVQFFAAEHGRIVYSAFGRTIAPWVFTAWILWGLALGYTTIWAADKGWPRARMWQLFGGCLMLDLVGESLLQHAGMYTYFGSQPLALFGVPIVWLFNWAATFMTAGLLARHLHARTSGYRRLLLLPLVGGISVAYPAFTAWPSTLGLGMEVSALWANLLALASILTILGTLDSVFRLCLTAPVSRSPHSASPRTSTTP